MALICESSSGSLPITSSLGALKEKLLLTVSDCVHETFNHLRAAFFSSSFSGEGGNRLPNIWRHLSNSLCSMQLSQRYNLPFWTCSFNCTLHEL